MEGTKEKNLKGVHGEERGEKYAVPQSLGQMSDANFPKDEEDRVYHLGVKRGQVCNRIITVGDAVRASMIASLLDNPEKNFIFASPRGFVTHTGTKNGVPITIIATGMGIPMMDFVVREARAVVDGPILMIRLGTCGTPKQNIPLGSIVVAESSIQVSRNVDAFLDDAKPSKSALGYYQVSKPVSADPELSKALRSNFTKKGVSVFSGVNITGDSFYSSQGRTSNYFKDHNNTLIEEIVKQYPEASSLEMETFHLLHLAKCSTKEYPVRATGAAIVLAQRITNEFLDNNRKKEMEKVGGATLLETLIEMKLDDKLVMHGSHCVWEQHSK